MKIYRKHGIRGIYKGTVISGIGEVSGIGVYFYTYKNLMNTVKYEEKLSSKRLLFSSLFGGIAGVMSWLVPYPVDAVKTLI